MSRNLRDSDSAAACLMGGPGMPRFLGDRREAETDTRRSHVRMEQSWSGESTRQGTAQPACGCRNQEEAWDSAPGQPQKEPTLPTRDLRLQLLKALLGIGAVHRLAHFARSSDVRRHPDGVSVVLALQSPPPRALQAEGSRAEVPAQAEGPSTVAALPRPVAGQDGGSRCVAHLVRGPWENRLVLGIPWALTFLPFKPANPPPRAGQQEPCRGGGGQQARRRRAGHETGAAGGPGGRPACKLEPLSGDSAGLSGPSAAHFSSFLSQPLLAGAVALSSPQPHPRRKPDPPGPRGAEGPWSCLVCGVAVPGG
ncbi:unnamed protein product [Rangifer tarandus platyrhynchus]|uniref:Uncharacterized protein n=1 Tax=Rangifer tarandus platyrhynchus TaxID=3082113 RepID=A0ABN8XWU1_RANTA|nr:unnamed protein product [Rangifer tarandus platyrhynchus]